MTAWGNSGSGGYCGYRGYCGLADDYPFRLILPCHMSAACRASEVPRRLMNNTHLVPCGYCGTRGFILDSAEYKNSPSSDSSLIHHRLTATSIISPQRQRRFWPPGVAFLSPRKPNQISVLTMNSEDNNDTNHAAQSSAKLSPSTSPEHPPFSLIHCCNGQLRSVNDSSGIGTSHCYITYYR
jgi:hypothetical protein